MVCTHNCVNDFLKDTGISVNNIAINLDQVFEIGKARPTAVLVDVKVYLEDL